MLYLLQRGQRDAVCRPIQTRPAGPQARLRAGRSGRPIGAVTPDQIRGNCREITPPPAGRSVEVLEAASSNPRGSQGRLPARSFSEERLSGRESALWEMVEGAGFEPAYAMRADLQSAAFNHSATPPQGAFRPRLNRPSCVLQETVSACGEACYASANQVTAPKQERGL